MSPAIVEVVEVEKAVYEVCTYKATTSEKAKEIFYTEGGCAK